MWDDRFSAENYIYGTEPNDFLRHNVASLPKGKILSLAEGEGRNAVFLAQQGYEVTAVDASNVGLEKARKLAKEKGVDIEFVHADLTQFDPGEAQWDGVISIFCPLPPEARQTFYRKILAGLKPGGVFLLEAYRPDQIHYGTGGGRDISVMQSKDSLLAELGELNFSHLVELEREVIEGTFHTGMGAVVQAIGVKK